MQAFLIVWVAGLWLLLVLVVVGMWLPNGRRRPSRVSPPVRHSAAHRMIHGIRGRRRIPAAVGGVSMERKKLLTVQEVADLFSISVREVWRRADSGQLPKPLRLGEKLRRWVREEIDTVIERAMRQREG